MQPSITPAGVLEAHHLTEVDRTGARLSAGCELRGCVIDGARSVERLRGARMPYVDVLAAAGTLAGALGITLIPDDDVQT